MGYHQDDEGHWIAQLSCGHCQHVRHKPPFVERLWVMTEAGREAYIGHPVECPQCLLKSSQEGEHNEGGETRADQSRRRTARSVKARSAGPISRLMR